MIMDEGQIQQFDTPENIIKHPKNEFVAKLIEIAQKQVEALKELS